MIGLKTYLRRNTISIGGVPSKNKSINLEWWSKKDNVGDYISKVVYDYMLNYYSLNANKTVKKTTHLMAVGSLIGMYEFDAIVWGSGVHCMNNVRNIYKQCKYRKYDIRLLRGPITSEILKSAGYSVPDVYGDPAVIMPLIYKPNVIEKTYDVSVILHLSQKKYEIEQTKSLNYINVETHDFRYFIDEIVKSKLIISSSLHGIILAEAYGVPAVFLKNGMDNELIKFYDWYFSTNRYSVIAVDSISDALCIAPMGLPNIQKMQNDVVNTFPVDLWNKK